MKSLAPVAVVLLALLAFAFRATEPEADGCFVARLIPLPDSVGFVGREDIVVGAVGEDGEQAAAMYQATRPKPDLVVIEAFGLCGGYAADSIAVPPHRSFYAPDGRELPSPLAPRVRADDRRTV